MFRKGKTRIIAKLHRTDIVICSHSREGKIPSYSQTNTVKEAAFAASCLKGSKFFIAADDLIEKEEKMKLAGLLPLQVYPRALANSEYLMIIFFFLIQIIRCDPLSELSVRMRGHNVCFYAELTKIIPNYHQILPLT